MHQRKLYYLNYLTHSKAGNRSSSMSLTKQKLSSSLPAGYFNTFSTITQKVGKNNYSRSWIGGKIRLMGRSVAGTYGGGKGTFSKAGVVKLIPKKVPKGNLHEHVTGG
jgi:hypothetical protein